MNRIFLFVFLLLPISTYATEVPVAVAEANELTTLNGEIQTTAAAATSATLSAMAMAQIKALNTSVPACVSKKQSADTMCLEKTAPSTSQFVQQYGAVVQMGIGIAGSLADQCGDIKKALGAASLALGAFQLGCGTTKGMCNSSCTSVVTQGKQLLTILQQVRAASIAAMEPPDPAVETLIGLTTKLNATAPQVVAGCNSYEKNIASAMAGIAPALLGMKQAANCQEANSTAMGEACVDPNHFQYNSPNCKCSRNELTGAECQGIATATQVGSGSNGLRVGAGGEASDGGSGSTTGADGNAAESAANAGGAASLPGSPVAGGGGGGMGGGSGGNGAAAQDGAGGARKLNANILGGFGGGGGGGSGGAGPGYGVDAKLQEHGPGGKMDPKRSLASQMAKEITSQGGRSNWEKVRDRYINNKRTLLMNK